MYSRIGRRAPLHCTALGKSLAAWEAEDWLDRFLRQRLRAYTPSTLVQPADVRREFQKIRANRYATDVEEFSVGLRCVAAPLFDQSRRVVASIGIAGPAVRLSTDRLPRLASLVRESAAASRALGGEVPV
jgi:IclR family transcriptional regulator, KDG regulon repressor